MPTADVDQAERPGAATWPSSWSSRCRAEFDPAKYHDDYREQVLELIERKAEGAEIAEAPEPPPAAPVVDLMAALEASLAAARAAKADDEEDGKKKRPRQKASA